MIFFLKVSIVYFNICITALWYVILSNLPDYGQVYQSGFLLLLVPASNFLLLVVLLDIDFFNSAFFHGQYVELNQEGVKIKKLFRTVSIKWNEVSSIDLTTIRGEKQINVTRRNPKDLSKFRYVLGKGFGFYCTVINIRKYSSIDIDRFIKTIKVHGKI